MTVRCIRMFVFALLLLGVSAPALAQGSSASSLVGVVVDTDGGAIPGATVVVTNNATKVTNEAVSNATGRFSFPGLDAGTYTVSVTLAGFKSYTATDVRLLAGRPSEVTARMEIGALTETVEVKAGAELVQTQSPAVTTTLSVEQLSELPIVSRNALYSVAMLPGVSTTGGPRNALINGLPNNTVNITIDGVGTGNALQSGDGFFSMVTPRMDAVEEITVTGAVPGVGAGAGSVQIAFVTRSGSNQFDSSIYHYFRHPSLNTNYFFNEVNNLDKNRVIVHQYGGRIGGPIVLPGYDGRGKAFFFLNFEHQHQPTSATRTRTILGEAARNGILRYETTGGAIQSVNVLAVAAANGQISTTDPVVVDLLRRVHEATLTTGTINDTTSLITQQYVFQAEGSGDQYAPTGRLDYNLTDRHRLSGTYYWQRFKSNPDLLNSREARYPGFTNIGQQNSYRTTGSLSLRSTLTQNMVNEFKGGWQWSPNDFFSNVTADQFADTAGYALSVPLFTATIHTISPAPRNTTTWSVSNDLSWLRGSHSFTFGGSFSGVHNRSNSWTVVPNIVLGFDQNNDPANAMFNATNFPGASNAQLNNARSLYGLLTGRVTSIPGTARLSAATGKYVYNGELEQKARQFSYAMYASDSWRVTPTLTVNAGLRWDVQMPFVPVTQTYSTTLLEDLCGISGVGSGPDGRQCNLFQPGNVSGKAQPQYYPFTPGTKAYNINYANIGYNLGFAWRPNVQDGLLRTILGSPEQATIRAGYSKTFNQERFDRFTANAGANPGGTTVANRNVTQYCLVCPGESWPLLFRERDRLGAPAFPEAPVYPINATTANSLNMFQADLKQPRVHSWSAGIQRSIGSDMAIEVRYVGNKNMYAWAEENWNERVIFENGFVEEWKLAQANLYANIAAGRGATFAYTGIPGTSPLPIHQAYLSGRSGADVTNPARYTASQYSNPTFLERFDRRDPSVAAAATALDTTAFRVNALAAGLPSNFFVMNPSTSGSWIVQDRNGTRYNSLQVDLRRRLSQGLLVQANYTYGIRKTLINNSIRFDRMEVDNTGAPHEWKANWVYEIPVGRGRRFGTDMNPIINGILGNWEFSGNGRIQTNRYRITNATLVGMTPKELQKEFKIRINTTATGSTIVYSMAQDIIDNTRRAYNTTVTTADGYSTLGAPTGRYIRPGGDEGCIMIYRQDCNAKDIQINGPLFTRVDMRIKKSFPFLSRGSMELMLEVFNVFDSENFNHQMNPGAGTGIFQVTSAYTDINTTFDPGGRIGQIHWRINW
jgi:hypothetical protein